jgi:PPOX class probable F420-dependent enzyme
MPSDMKTLGDFATLAREGRGLASVAVLRADATIHSSVVNVALLLDPHSGEPAIGFVTYGAVKLRNLRLRPQCTVTVVSGRQWVTVEGSAEVVGPDDQPAWFDGDRLPALLREVFIAAGGTHDDWEAYDRVMAEQRRAAVFVSPHRIYGV